MRHPPSREGSFAERYGGRIRFMRTKGEVAGAASVNFTERHRNTGVAHRATPVRPSDGQSVGKARQFAPPPWEGIFTEYQRLSQEYHGATLCTWASAVPMHNPCRSALCLTCCDPSTSAARSALPLRSSIRGKVSAVCDGGRVISRSAPGTEYRKTPVCRTSLPVGSSFIEHDFNATAEDSAATGAGADLQPRKVALRP